MPKKIIKYVVLLVVAVNVAIIAIVLWSGKAPPRRPMPNPNGYDDFVRAGRALTGSPQNYAAMSEEALANCVSQNKQALDLARLGLGRECLAPDDYSADYMKQFVRDATPFRQVASVLCAEGRLAEIKGRTNDAVKSYLDAVQFGVKCSNGGVMILKLIGIGCESEGRARLELLAASLEAQACREAAQRLEALNAAEEPMADTFKQESAWVSRTLGLRGELLRLLAYKDIRQHRQSVTAKYQKNRRQRIQLTITLGARAYELEKGKKPQSLAELVPAYLKSIPMDPVTGTNMTYAP